MMNPDEKMLKKSWLVFNWLYNTLFMYFNLKMLCLKSSNAQMKQYLTFCIVCMLSVFFVTDKVCAVEYKNDHIIFDLIKNRKRKDEEKFFKLIGIKSNLEVRNSDGETPILFAARCGFWDYVDELIKVGANINVRDKDGCTLLMYAMSSYSNNYEITKRIAENTSDYNALDNKKRSILHYAAIGPSIEKLELALTLFDDINFKDADGKTAFSYAFSQSGARLNMSYLFAMGADPCITSNDGRDIAWDSKVFRKTYDPFEVYRFLPLSALYEPVMGFGEKPEIELSADEQRLLQIENSTLEKEKIEEFISSGGNVNMPTPNGKLLLNLAASDYSKGHELVRFLIDHGADISKSDYHGQNALFYAIKSGNNKTVALLVESGVPIDARDKLGQTPLFYAAAEGDLKVVQLLLELGADIHAHSKFGETALLWAAFGASEYHDTNKMVSLLLKSGANPNDMSNSGITPLWCSIYRNRFNTAKLLIEHGACINYKTLHPIDVCKNVDFTTYLVDKGLDVNTFVIADSGWIGSWSNMKAPLLYWAVQNNHKNLVKAILSKNPDINMKAENGETSLLLAVQKNNEPMVQLLLDANADVNIPRTDGQTPLIRAAKKCKPDMVKLLIAAGATISSEDFDKFIAHDINVNWMKKHGIYNSLMETIPVQQEEVPGPAVNEATTSNAIPSVEEQRVEPVEMEENSSVPQIETGKEKNTAATPREEKTSVPSEVKPEPSAPLPADALQSAPPQTSATAVPVEQREVPVPAAVIPASPVPEVSMQPATTDAAEKEKNIPKKLFTIANFVGTWKGQFTNAYGKTAATLTIMEQGKRPYCVFTFYPLRENPGAGSGQFEMNVSLNEETGDCELRGVRWIKNPKRRALMHLRGTFNGNEFSGKIFADIPTPDDWIFKLERNVQ